MPNDTDNHGYNRPDEGEQNWDDLLNANFSELDADVIVKGTYANRPADPAADAWYLATDRRIIYHYDGSSWTAVAGVGTDSSPIPSEHVEDATHTNSYTDPGGATHTGELADIGDVRSDEEIEDTVAALLAAGDKLSWSYDDQAGTLTVDTTALDEEEVEDAVATLLAGDSNTTVSYDDANDTLTIGIADDVSVNSLDAGSVQTDEVSNITQLHAAEWADSGSGTDADPYVSGVANAGDELRSRGVAGVIKLGANIYEEPELSGHLPDNVRVVGPEATENPDDLTDLDGFGVVRPDGDHTVTSGPGASEFAAPTFEFVLFSEHPGGQTVPLVDLNGTTWTRWERCTFHAPSLSSGTPAVRCEDQAHFNSFLDCRIDGCGDGFANVKTGANAQPSANRFIRCHVQDFVGTAFDLTDGVNVTVEDCSANVPQADGVTAYQIGGGSGNPEDMTVARCRYENSTGVSNDVAFSVADNVSSWRLKHPRAISAATDYDRSDNAAGFDGLENMDVLATGVTGDVTAGSTTTVNLGAPSSPAWARAELSGMPVATVLLNTGIGSGNVDWDWWLSADGSQGGANQLELVIENKSSSSRSSGFAYKVIGM